MEFESLPADVRTVFGTGSPEDVAVSAALALPRTPANAPARQAPNTDYLGIAVHCARAARSATTATPAPICCRTSRAAIPASRRSFGNVNVAPVICAAAPAGCDGERQRQGHRRQRHRRCLRPSRLPQHLQPDRPRSRSATPPPCSRRACRSSTSMSPMRMTAIRCRSIPPPICRARPTPSARAKPNTSRSSRPMTSRSASSSTGLPPTASPRRTRCSS